MHRPCEHRVSTGAGLGLQNNAGGTDEPKKENLYAFLREAHILQGRGNKEKNCL